MLADNTGLQDVTPSYEELMARITQANSPMEGLLYGFIYGESGKGKTVLSCQILVELNRLKGLQKGIILIESAHGGNSIRNHPEIAPFVHRIPYQSYEQVIMIARAIADGYGIFANYSGIVLDEFTSMARAETDRVHSERIRNGILQPSEINEKADKGVTPTWPTYNATAVRTRKMLDALVRSGVSFILTGHEKDFKTKDQTVYKIGPKLSAAIDEVAVETVDFILRLTANQYKDPSTNSMVYNRVAQVHSTGAYVTKSRIPFVGTEMPVADVPYWAANWAVSNQRPLGPEQVEQSGKTVEEIPADEVNTEVPAQEIPTETISEEVVTPSAETFDLEAELEQFGI